MKKNKGNLELALLSYRTTPLETGFSPAELMFKRKLRNNLPAFFPEKSSYLGNNITFHKREEKYQEKYKKNFDRRHKASNLTPLMEGEMVWITDLRRHGQIMKKLKEPRSYLVETDKRTVRRNRINLVPAPYLEDVKCNKMGSASLKPPSKEHHVTNPSDPGETVQSRYRPKRFINKPIRYRDS